MNSVYVRPIPIFQAAKVGKTDEAGLGEIFYN